MPSTHRTQVAEIASDWKSYYESNSSLALFYLIPKTWLTLLRNKHKHKNKDVHTIDKRMRSASYLMVENVFIFLHLLTLVFIHYHFLVRAYVSANACAHFTKNVQAEEIQAA